MGTRRGNGGSERGRSPVASNSCGAGGQPVPRTIRRWRVVMCTCAYTHHISHPPHALSHTSSKHLLLPTSTPHASSLTSSHSHTHSHTHTPSHTLPLPAHTPHAYAHTQPPQPCVQRSNEPT